MPTKPTKNDEQRRKPSISPKKAITLLERQVAEANELLAAKPSGIPTAALEGWESTVTHWLNEAFGDWSKANEIESTRANHPFQMMMTEPEIAKLNVEALTNKVARLRSHIGILKDMAALEEENADTAQMDLSGLASDGASPTKAPSEPAARSGPHKVFLVHGRNEQAKAQIEAFLRKLGLEPIVLNQKANEGATIIEKFEKHSEVSFAVVLLTPDDIGGLAETPGDLKQRARQNVILELGYFLGRLGRPRVCALKLGEMELPTDFLGVGYIELDPYEGWKQRLFQEMRAVMKLDPALMFD